MKFMYFDCQCSDFNHTFRFVYDPDDDDELYLEVRMNHYLPWYQRLMVALQYLFKVERSYGGYDTVMLRQEDRHKLIQFLSPDHMDRMEG